MGWRYRKSINLGLGFRINLSKSGIGYSWGIPGYRITKMSNGGNRTTYSIPGTGISYVEQNGKNTKRSDGLYTGEEESFENIPIEEIRKNDPILKKINRIASLNRLANILLFSVLFVTFIPAFSLTFILGAIIKIIIATSKQIGIYYEFDNESREMYNSLKEVLIQLSNSDRVWQVESSTQVYNKRYNAGAGRNLKRNRAFVTTKLPYYLKTNINIYGIKLKNQKMFFTPDRVIIFRSLRKAFGCTYNDMFLGVDTTLFIESEYVCKDANVVEYTWHYANNDGSRDLRFSNNKRYPVCRYGELTLKSPHGINTILHFSDEELTKDIQFNLILFGNAFNKILAKSRGLLEEKEEPKKEKNVVKDISELQMKKENNSNETIKEEQKIEPEKEYKLPKLSILGDKESKGIIPYIEKMKNKKGIAIPIGSNEKDIIIENINTMPNLLIGGTVMSGKTSFINTIICSILLTKKPTEVKLMIFDSKRIDYVIYNSIPHLMIPVISDIKKLNISLQMVCSEIQRRMDLLRETNSKNIDSYNKNAECKYHDIVVILDDYSGLNNMEEINESIEYITANGWNVNVYMIVSSNHPSAKVIPTVSKANFPARLSFKVVSSQASQIILDEVGAEKLSGQGSALYTSRLNESLLKIKVPYITDDDINRIANYCKEQLPLQYMKIENNTNNKTEKYDDPMYNEVVEFAIQTGKISASLIQRRFRFGYNRAERMIDLLEARGIVGPSNGSKPREVLVKMEEDDTWQ